MNEAVSVPIPVILAGFGWWTQNRTVIPLLEGDPAIMHVVAITSLREGENEFHAVVEPIFRSKGWEVPAFFDELSEAFNGVRGKPKPVALIVNTPNRFHFSEAKMGLEAGLHVYAERPIVCPDDNLEHLIQIAEQRNRLLFTGVQRRLEATYRYLYEAVARNINFGRLTSIRCFLAVGEQLQDWRRRLDLAGGGIVLDSGYHLLDAAAWIAGATGIEISERLLGATLVTKEEPPSETNSPLEVETTAVGYIMLPGGVLLTFDLSYHAPFHSIYERVEIRDDMGSRIVLMRNQSERSSMPATVTHQQPDGKLVMATASPNFGVRINGIHLSGTANNTGPLRSFLRKISQGASNRQEIDVCDARSSLNTWRLIRGIYHLASTDHSGDSHES